MKIGDNYNYIKFNGNILNFILNIIRNNLSLICQLGLNANTIKENKITDELVKNLFLNDKENIKEISKKLIINEIISHDNLDSFKSIKSSIFPSIKETFDDDKIEELILSMTNKTLTHNKKAKFSIKDKYLQYLDISSVYNLYKKSSMLKYINNFKKEIISIYNVYFYPFIKYEINLQNNLTKNFFINQSNFDIVFKLTELLLTNESYFIFQEFFLNELINYWNIFFYECGKNINDYEYKSFLNNNRATIEKLINILQKNSLTDQSLKSFCISVIDKITSNELFVYYKLMENERVVKPEKMSLKNSVREHMKNKFKKNYQKFNKLYRIDTIKIENKHLETCIYCLKLIKKNDITNLYGKLLSFRNDYFYSNSFCRTLLNKYSNYNNIQKVIEQKLKDSGLLMSSCNHIIHNLCFMKLFNNSNTLKCPLCNQFALCIIPYLNKCNDEDIQSAIKGYEIFEKENKSFYIKIDEGSDELNQKLKEMYKDKKTEALYHDIMYTAKIYYALISSNFKINGEIVDFGFSIIEIIERFSRYFSNFYDLINNDNDIQNKFECYENFIYIIRILIRIQNLNTNTAFGILNDSLISLLSLDNKIFCEILFEDKIKEILAKILFIISLLFDYEYIKGYEKYILKIFLPLYPIQYFIRKIIIDNKLNIDIKLITEKYNNSELEKYLKSDKSLQQILEYLCKCIMLNNIIIRKNNIENQKINEDISLNLNDMLEKIGLSEYESKSVWDIINSLDSFKIENPNNEFHSFFNQHITESKILSNFFFYIFDIKYKNVIQEYLKNYLNKNNYIHPNLLGSYMPIKYKFISLPNFAIDFQFKYFDIPCSYCKKV